jgi:opacity protein-like surface antigen
VTPLADRTSNTSAVDLTYQFGASSVVGASGNSYLTNYNHDASATTTLVDSNAVGADGFYAHRFANRHWAGVMYNFQRLQFQPGNRTNVQRTPVFYAVSIGTHTMLSLWAGPEYSITPRALTVSAPGASVSESRWGGMGGTDISWQGARTAFRAGYLQQTSDGGGLAEAVVLREFTAGAHRRLSTRWTLTADLAFSQDNPLNPTSGISPYRTWTGGGGLEYAFTDHWMMRLRYDREHLYTDTTPSISPTNRNRVLISFGYSFSRPLGR